MSSQVLFTQVWWKSLAGLKDDLGLEKNHENLTKNGMNPILSRLYNPYIDTLFLVPSLWFPTKWPVTLWFGVFLNWYHLCLLCGSFDGIYLISSERLCPRPTWGPKPSTPTFHFLASSLWSARSELGGGHLLSSLHHTQTRGHFPGHQCVPLAKCPISLRLQKDSNMPILPVWKHNGTRCK